MLLNELLGFNWHGIAPTTEEPLPKSEVLSHWRKMLAQVVWDAAALEGNTFTFPEVVTLLEGVTIGGHKVSEEQQIFALSNAANELHSLISSDSFKLDINTSNRLHAITAQHEALDAVHIRGTGSAGGTPRVALGGQGTYLPIETEPGGANLISLFTDGLRAIETSGLDIPAQAALIFAFNTYHQFYFDGNKRTARFMMNGHRMSHGYEAISIPFSKQAQFNQSLVELFKNKDATTLITFLDSVHPSKLITVRAEIPHKSATYNPEPAPRSISSDTLGLGL